MARPSSGQAPKKGKRNRKHKRNLVFCARYKAEDRRTRNKKRKIRRHLRRYPNDGAAARALARL